MVSDIITPGKYPPGPHGRTDIAGCISCPGYVELRMGKDMRRVEDLVAYFREVMILREQRKCNK